MQIPFSGGHYLGRMPDLNAQVCQNLIPISERFGGKSDQAMMHTPGLTEFADTGTAAEARGALVWNGFLFAVFGDTLWKITTAGVASNVGTLETHIGRVYMAGGTTHLCIVDGAKGYYRTKEDRTPVTTLTEITDDDFPLSPASVCYLDGYFIINKDDTDLMYISGLEDASSWGALDFSSAEEQPDDLILVHAYLRHLIALGEDTVEVFYNTGDVDFPFQRVAGAINPFGLGARASVASGVEGLFFLDNNYQVRQVQGYTAHRISTDGLEYHFRKYADPDLAYGYTYTQEGHGFYVLTFPTPSKTWAYDITTGLWHTRASGLYQNRHKSAWHCWFAGKNIVGDPLNGKVYEMSLDTYADDGETIQRRRTTQPIQAGQKNLFFHSLNIDVAAGVGLVTGQGEDPMIMLDWSDDGAHTWSNEMWTSMGKIGEYETEVEFRRLGKSRNRIFRITISDPVPVLIMGAEAEIEREA